MEIRTTTKPTAASNRLVGGFLGRLAGVLAGASEGVFAGEVIVERGLNPRRGEPDGEQ
jgi:hypothetical protein